MATRKVTKKIKSSYIKPLKKVTIASAGASQEISYDTKIIITLLLLLFFYPLGLIFMWTWMQWKGWLKFLVTLPLILTMFVMFTMIALVGKAVRTATDERHMQMRYQQMQTTTPTPTVSSFQ